MSERCSQCGRARPGYIADPTCERGGYCHWETPPNPVAEMQALLDQSVEAIQLEDFK